MSEQNLVAIYIPLACLIVIGAFPVAIYIFYFLYRDWNKQYVVKRRRILICTFSAELCAVIFLYLPLIIASEMSSQDTSKPLSSVVGFLGYFLFLPIIASIGPLVSIRAWLLYYDMSLSKTELTRQWRIVIDPLSQSKDWFLQNQYRWGNVRFLSYLGILAVIIQNGAMLVGFFLSPNTYIPRNTMLQLIGYVWWIVYCIFMIKIWSKLRVFDYYDNFGIRSELLATIIYALAFTFVGTIVAALFIILTNFTKFNKSTMIAIESYFIFFSSFFALCIIPLIRFTNEKKHGSNADVFEKYENKNDKSNDNKKHKKNTRKHKRKKKTRKETVESTSGSKFGSKNTSKSSKSGRSGKGGDDSSNESSSFHIRIMRDWTPIVVTEYGYNAFMAHLQKEFSVESLLFISEVSSCLFVCLLVCFCRKLCFFLHCF